MRAKIPFGLSCVVAALGWADAASAESNVQIYGFLHSSLENVRADGPSTVQRSTLPAGGIPLGAGFSPRNAVSNNSSHIGFRGTEDMGNGWSAWFQAESAYPIDGEGGAFGARNSGVGLRSSKYGTLFFGQWDTPYKNATLPLGAFYNSGIAGNNAFTGSPGFSVLSGTFAGPEQGARQAAAFDRRQRNSLQYWSPEWKGAQLKAVVAQTESKPAGSAFSPILWGVTLNYSSGPLYLTYSYERHEDFFGTRAMDGGVGAAALPATTGQSSTDEGHKVGALYTFSFYGKTMVGVMYERLQYKREGIAAAGVVSEYERDYWMVTLRQTLGQIPVTLRAQYGRATPQDCMLANAAPCDTSGLDADVLSLGASYHFSKRTQVYVLYTRIQNDNDQSFQFGGQNTNGVTAAAGADLKGIGLGIVHVF